VCWQTSDSAFESQVLLFLVVGEGQLQNEEFLVGTEVGLHVLHGLPRRHSEVDLAARWSSNGQEVLRLVVAGELEERDGLGL